MEQATEQETGGAVAAELVRRGFRWQDAAGGFGFWWRQGIRVEVVTTYEGTPVEVDGLVTVRQFVAPAGSAAGSAEWLEVLASKDVYGDVVGTWPMLVEALGREVHGHSALYAVRGGGPFSLDARLLAAGGASLPILRDPSGEVVGNELSRLVGLVGALLALREPEGGYPTPDDLVEALEEAGAYVSLEVGRGGLSTAWAALALDLPEVVTLDDAARANAACPDCDGSRMDRAGVYDCPTCDGAGWVAPLDLGGRS